MTLRFGIDLGGTKTEIVALREKDPQILYRKRIPTNRTYEGVIEGIKSLVEEAETELKEKGSVGLGIPGAICPARGVIKNANSTWLNDKPFDKDLELALNRPIKLANDADCLALSEATDGAGKEAEIVWAVILGTGAGSGIVAYKRLLQGANAICGEWGHNPLPLLTKEEAQNTPCYCGKAGCVETMLSGTGFEKDYFLETKEKKSAKEIVLEAENQDAKAQLVMTRYEDRLARAMAGVVNILDPHIIVLGGGMSNVDRLYDNVPKIWGKYISSQIILTKLKKAEHGDSSGVRGAAWLWNNQE